MVYVSPSEDYLVPYASRAFLNSEAFLKKLFDFRPERKITVLLTDLSDSGNAGASAVPWPALRVQIAPLSYTFETITANERMFAIMNHELVHVIAMDQAAPRDRRWRRFFGGKVIPVDAQPESILYFYLTSPRVAAPRWYHEGAAVFIDTWMAGGIGRAQSGYDEMVFRSMVRDQAHFYDPLGLVAEGTKIDFQTEANSYLYGARFMTYLANRYTPEQVVKWIGRGPDSKPYFASQFQHVFGTPLKSAWSDWMTFEREFQNTNLGTIRKYPVTPATDLSARALGSVSRGFYDADTKTIYAAFNYPGVTAHIGAISTETGATERLVDVKGPLIYQVSSLAWDPANRTIFYTTDNGAHRDLMTLDTRTRRARQLQKDARIGDLAFNRADRSLWGVRTLNGLHTIVQMAPPYTTWTGVVTLPYGTTVYDLDISPDGSMLVATFGEISGKQDVRLLPLVRLRAGDVTPAARFEVGPGVPNDFVFSPDGRYLYGSSYLTGTSNIFRYEIATKATEAVSNTETGFFRPIPLGNDQLIVFRYTGQGFVPARITATPLADVNAITFLGERTIAKHEVLKTWQAGSPADIPFDTLAKTTARYRLGSGLAFESFYPVVQGYKNDGAIGVRATFSDPLQFNRLAVSATVLPHTSLPAAERMHMSAEYERYDWTVRASLNRADFYDLFGPTKTSRKGYSISLGRSKVLLYDQPRRLTFHAEGTVAGNLDQLPEYQDVPVVVDSLITGSADLSWSNVRGSLGRVDDEKGRLATAVVRVDRVNGSFFTRVRGTFDAGLLTPIPHSSIWVRSAAGFSPNDATEPFSNFFFGAFGNNFIDHRDVKRYRQYSSFPGADISELAGRNFVRSTIEWNLPPLRFERAGTPSAFPSWMRPAVFVSGLVTNLDHDAAQHRALSVGGQLDFRFTVLSTMDMTLSAGAAVRTVNGRPARREAMISLAVLK